MNRRLLLIVCALLLVLVGTVLPQSSMAQAHQTESGSPNRNAGSSLSDVSTVSSGQVPAVTLGSAFTYQGFLRNGGNPANGQYDFQFTLYDAATSGNQVGSPILVSNQTVSSGLFTVRLDFGPSAFQGSARWLEMAVRQTGGGGYTTLSPRQELTASPYALGLMPGAVINGSSGTSLLTANNANANGLLGISNQGDLNAGVYGSSTALDGNGVIGEAPNGALAIGVWGRSNQGLGGSFESITGIGTEGLSDNNVGVYGRGPLGVSGYASSPTGVGVAGSGHVGVFGEADRADGYGLLGNSHGNNSVAVEGFAPSGQNAVGVLGYSNGNPGTGGYFYGPTIGLYATSANGSGVESVISNTRAAVAGVNDALVGPGYGGYFTSGSSAGVYGQSGGNWQPGVYGYNGNSSGASGVLGNAESGFGVFGYSRRGVGVAGDTSTGTGVVGSSEATNGTGVYGVASGSPNAVGVYGMSDPATGGHAGWFRGNVRITGACCSMSEGTTQIDDPLDPANLYLNQSVVQSPEMKDIYDGVVTTGDDGLAVVTMSAWFQAANRDFRYQLTCIGQFAQAIVWSEIKDNHFTIKTDKPNVKVSWQVTGIRQDPYANAHPVTVEQAKPADEKGLYLHPELYGQPDSKAIGYDKVQQAQQQDQQQVKALQQQQTQPSPVQPTPQVPQPQVPNPLPPPPTPPAPGKK